MIIKGKDLLNNSVVKYGIVSLFTRVLAIVSSICLTPLIMNKTNTEAYGIWFLATLVPTIIAFPDLGLSNGVVNKITEYNRNNTDKKLILEFIESIIILLKFLAVIWSIIGFVAIFCYTIDYSVSLSSNILLQSLLLALLIFCVGIPPVVWTKVQLAFEEGHRAVFWEGIGKLFSLIVSIAVLSIYPDIRFVIIATLLPPVTALYLNAFLFRNFLFSSDKKQTKKYNIRFIIKENTGLIKDSLYFTIIQLAFVIGFAFDNFLIGKFVSIESVSYVSILRRPFDALPLVITLFSTALWPVFNRLQAEGKYVKSRNIIYKLFSWSIITVVSLSFVIFWYREVIYRFLSQGNIFANETDMFWIALKALSITLIIILQNYAYAAGLLKQQAIIQIISALISVVFVIAFLVQKDISGYLCATAIIYLFFNLIPMLYLVVKDLNFKIENQS